jgi:hypothetical protein
VLALGLVAVALVVDLWFHRRRVRRALRDRPVGPEGRWRLP